MFNTCHYTVLLSPGVDILPNWNWNWYFPVPRVGQNLTKKLQKNSNAAPLPVPHPPHLRLNIDTCISFCDIEKHSLKQLLQTPAIFNTKSQQIIV